MDSAKNRNYQIGYIMCILSAGLMFLENINLFDLGLVDYPQKTGQ